MASARMPVAMTLKIMERALQPSEDTPFPEHGCTGATGGSGRWTHPREPNPRRITPSVRPHLISDKDTPIAAGKRSVPELTFSKQPFRIHRHRQRFLCIADGRFEWEVIASSPPKGDRVIFSTY
jgi:hypothetical protein